MYRTITQKVFWQNDAIIMQNLSDILPLFCTPTWPSYHVSENQEYQLVVNKRVLIIIIVIIIIIIIIIIMRFPEEAPLKRRWFSGRSYIQSNWSLDMSILGERGEPENPEKNLSEKSKEPTTNLTHIWPRVRNRTQATSAERRVQSPPMWSSIYPYFITASHARFLANLSY